MMWLVELFLVIVIDFCEVDGLAGAHAQLIPQMAVVELRDHSTRMKKSFKTDQASVP
jgi:hypothetical protein